MKKVIAFFDIILGVLSIMLGTKSLMAKEKE